LATAAREIRDLDFHGIEPWMNAEEPEGSPFFSTDAPPMEAAALGDLIAYYRRERLGPQMVYARKRASRNAWIEQFTRHIAPGLFFLSVLAVFGHFAYDYVTDSHRTAISKILIVLAAGLPAVGAGLRTIQSAGEFGRNSCRFRAMHLALIQLDEKLQRNPGPRESLDCLRHSERILGSEHREWLRLMAQAEWYG
jgi:hypothetical protein